MPAALLSFLLNPKVLGAIGVALLLAFAGIQTARLNNAKADQIDPATKKTWKSEELSDGPALALANRNLQGCQANYQVEDAALTRQGAAVAAMQAESASDTQKATAAAQQASSASAAASKLAVQILAPHTDHSCDAALALAKASLP